MTAKTGAAHGKHKPPARLSLDWFRWAACEGEDTEAFFDPAREREAVAFCHAYCLVRTECAAWATSTGSTGVWGGMTHDERRGLRRREQRRASARAASKTP